jgi:hypothetical protein
MLANSFAVCTAAPLDVYYCFDINYLHHHWWIAAFNSVSGPMGGSHPVEFIILNCQLPLFL